MKTNKLLAIVAILSVVFLSGCKKDMYQEVIGKCPIVVSTNPANGDTNVTVYKVITATFNEPINPASITQASFTIQGSPAIAGTISYKDSTATFIPSSPLTPNHIYTGRITTAIRDLNGNALQKDYVWTFTTGENLPPTIIYTDPKNNDTAVVLNKKITAIFNVPMNPSTITAAGTFTLKQTSNSAAVSGTVAYSNSTAIFSPTALLMPGTSYTATITSAAKNVAGTPMASNYVWTFTTGALLAPTVIFTNPANNDTGVVLNKIVTATFSVPMNSSTITAAGTYTLKQTLTSTPVLGIVTYSSSTAIFTPSSALLPGTQYTATITTAAKNLAGTSMANTYTWTFTTLSPNAPTVIYTDPKNNDTAVVLNKIVTAIFSVPMNSSTITAAGTFTIKQTLSSAPVSGSISYSGSTAIFTPTGNLLPGTNYTATITNAAKNLAGTSMVSNYVWTFTTLTLKAPTVIFTNPADLDTGVILSIKVTATFSEPMDQATLKSPATNFTLKQTLTSTPVSGTVSYSSSTAIFTPTALLLPNTKYTATIKTGAKNPAGTPLSSDYVWVFTTAKASGAPIVISTDPQNLDTGVLVNKTITATFNMPMKSLTINGTTFGLKLGTTTINGVVTYSGVTASFNPDVDLLFDTTYTATITTGVQNVAGIGMVSDYIWTFRTMKDTTSATVDILKSAGNFGILAGVGITNAAGASVINNMDVGIYPGVRSSVVGFPPATVLNGSIFCSDDVAPPGVAAMLLQAKTDLTNAYLYLEGATAPAPATISGDQGGLTLAPGIYKSTTTLLIQSGNLTLDGQGNPNAIWIFQIAAGFTTIGSGPFPSSTGGNVILTGSAQAKNVYWQVGSSAVIGDYTNFYGNILALTSITMNSHAVATGRMLARNGAVTMTSTNTINKP
jgi:hypothetical protein